MKITEVTHQVNGIKRRSRLSEIKLARPRTTVQVYFPDGRVYEGPTATPLEEFMRAAQPKGEPIIVAALVNGKLQELCVPVTRDVDVQPITIANSDGMRIYRRSLCFLLVTAARELYPEARVVVDHSLTLGGLFCHVEGREPLSREEVERLEARMWEIVKEDARISKHRMPLDRALAMFRAQGSDDKLRLLKYRNKDYLWIYELRNFRDYFYGYMVPSAGYLSKFSLRYYSPGFILQFPTRSAPMTMPAYHDFPKLAGMFQQYGNWLRHLEIQDVASLNHAIETGRIREVILVAEALHQQRLAEVAQYIISRQDKVRLVLLGGPSSSGKTTLSKRLAIQLLANGIHPIAISLDDYFVNREDTPRDENGEYDFEALGALDLPLLNQQIQYLLEGKEVTLPKYNFRTGKREWGRTVCLSPQDIILAEGLHGLNPNLLPDIPDERICRIYVSALTQLNIDRHNRVPTTDTRLLRRMVRDAAYRGYTAAETIQRWESVGRGEHRYVFPYQENADLMFNTALAYELAVLKPFAEPLLRQVEPGTMEYVEARRLLSFLQWFLPCPPDAVPDNSILREFIGGSILRDYSR